MYVALPKKVRKQYSLNVTPNTHTHWKWKPNSIWIENLCRPHQPSFHRTEEEQHYSKCNILVWRWRINDHHRSPTATTHQPTNQPTSPPLIMHPKYVFFRRQRLAISSAKEVPSMYCHHSFGPLPLFRPAKYHRWERGQRRRGRQLLCLRGVFVIGFRKQTIPLVIQNKYLYLHTYYLYVEMIIMISDCGGW